MPKTIQHELKVRALVIYSDGDSRTRPFDNEQHANDWIDRQFDRYGNHIVATDVFPNDVIVC